MRISSPNLLRVLSSDLGQKISDIWTSITFVKVGPVLTNEFSWLKKLYESLLLRNDYRHIYN